MELKYIIDGLANGKFVSSNRTFMELKCVNHPATENCHQF